MWYRWQSSTRPKNVPYLVVNTPLLVAENCQSLTAHKSWKMLTKYMNVKYRLKDNFITFLLVYNMWGLMMLSKEIFAKR